MNIRSARLRLKRLLVVQLVLAMLFLVIALVVREVVLALTRAVTRISNPPPVWFGPKGAAFVGSSGAMYALWAAAVTVVLGYLGYRMYVRLIEARPLQELALGAAVTEFATGTGIGFAIVAVVLAALVVFGYASVGVANEWWWALAASATAVTAAFMEELFFRGVLFRLVEQRVGSWLSIALSALVFGYAHARNPAAAAWSVAAIGLSAGVVLPLAFMATRRLWLPIGVHFGVNVTQGAIFGVPVSGHPTRGVFAADVHGPPLLTGGSFGLEASVLVLVVAVIVAAALIRCAAARKQIVGLKVPGRR